MEEVHDVVEVDGRTAVFRHARAPDAADQIVQDHLFEDSSSELEDTAVYTCAACGSKALLSGKFCGECGAKRPSELDQLLQFF
jgi:hypothetical protein